MSQEQVLKTLVDLGLDELEAKIYFYLAKKGTSKASDICRVFRITKQQFYPSIKQLQGRGTVTSTMEHPARFNAMSFEKVLDSFIKEMMQEVQQLQQSRSDILSVLHNARLEDEASPKFGIIQSRVSIFNKIQRMFENAQSQILAITTVPTLMQANERDIFDSRQIKPEVKLRFLVELGEQNARVMKLLLKNESFNMQLEGKSPDLYSAPFPQMFVRDEEEALFFIKPRTENSIIEKNDVCLWTDCKALVKSFKSLFEDTWRCSISLEEKQRELESGKPTPKAILISDAEAAKKLYHSILKGAKEEILATVSSKGLIELVKDLAGLSDSLEMDIEARIMSPIMEDSCGIAFLSFCSIRHVPPNYRQIVIVDGKYLFQFGSSNSREPQLDDPLKFENIMFVTNPEYITKTKQMLDEVWKNASPLSSENLKSLLGDSPRSQSAYFPGAIRCPGPHGTFYPLFVVDEPNSETYPTIEVVNDDPKGLLKEQDVLNEIIEDQKTRRLSTEGSFRVYSTQGIAVIHPQSSLKLPSMLIRIHHIEKQSTFGEEDAIIINTLLETPIGQAYVPVAVLSNSLKAQIIWGRHFKPFPAGRNINIAKQGELEVWVHGNTLFAAWAVPIPLLPSENVLPPSCILIEGYGNVKTEAYTIVQPTGGKFSAKQNGLDAFVTFMHPASKYSGSGTDGFLVRDFAMVVTPQFIEGFDPTNQVRLVHKDKH